MDSDKKHGAAWACEGSTSDRDLTVDRSVSDRTSWTLWCGKRTAGMEEGDRNGDCPDWCCNFSVEIVQ